MAKIMQNKYKLLRAMVPVLMAERSKTCTAFDRSNTGIVGSNPARGMDVYFCVFYVVFSCVGRDFASGWSPSKESYQLSKIDS
jgi:hypothetical protein